MTTRIPSKAITGLYGTIVKKFSVTARLTFIDPSKTSDY